jgi:hypothetical protein
MFKDLKSSKFLISILVLLIAACEEKKDEVPDVNINGAWKILSYEESGRFSRPAEELPQYWVFESSNHQRLSKTVKDARRTITGQFKLSFQPENFTFQLVGKNLYHIVGDPGEINYRALDRVPDPNGDILRIQQLINNQSILIRLQQVPVEKINEIRSQSLDQPNFQGKLRAAKGEQFLQFVGSPGVSMPAVSNPAAGSPAVQTPAGGGTPAVQSPAGGSPAVQTPMPSPVLDQTNQRAAACMVLAASGSPLILKVIAAGRGASRNEVIEITFSQNSFNGLSAVPENLKIKYVVLSLGDGDEPDLAESFELTKEECKGSSIQRNGDSISMNLNCGKEKLSLTGSAQCVPTLEWTP